MGQFIIRSGIVLTMDDLLGDIPDGGVHVADGTIVAVGAGIEAPGVPIVDARDMIVMPGLVETHWHMWNTLMRSLSEPAGYFATKARFGPLFRPEDVYHSTMLACTEAIHSGITFVHDWCHNTIAPDESLRALRTSGLRGRFSYGWREGLAGDRPTDLGDLRRLHAEWAPGLVSLGMAWRGSGNTSAVTVPRRVYREEFEAARSLGIPVSVHASASRFLAGQVAGLADEGFLGPDVQVIHAGTATETEIAALAEAGTAVSVSPFSELRVGYGFPHVRRFLDAGVRLGLSIDTTMLSGNADMFATMKVTQGIENGRSESESALTSRRVLELATIDGARSMGLGDVIGSLTPGKRADIIAVSTRNPNMAVVTDPAQLLVTAAGPADVDTVIVDGRILKRGGALTEVDPREIGRGARAALARLRHRAGTAE
jgi:5-methylthioadenosine/S-adenosylhomocysteine deaminase